MAKCIYFFALVGVQPLSSNSNNFIFNVKNIPGKDIDLKSLADYNYQYSGVQSQKKKKWHFKQIVALMCFISVQISYILYKYPR